MLWISLASYCSKFIVWEICIVWEIWDSLLSPRKVGFLAKNWTIIFDPHHGLNTCSFYSNPTGSSAIGRVYFRIWSLFLLFFIKLFFIKFISMLFFHQMITLLKLWKKFFVSSKKLFLFSRCSNFCDFFPSFPHFPDSKGQMEKE